MTSNIAFFDSGQGGLTVWEPVTRRFPSLNTHYLGDNARTPYGNKGRDIIQRYTAEAVLFLASQGAELIVVACGTASSVAVKSLQNLFRIPIIGIVEGLCDEAMRLGDPSRTIAVLGTRFTISSGRFEEELLLRGAQRIWQRACPLFVPIVEEGVAPGPLAEAASEMYLWDVPEDVKVVMLACTHYPRIAQSIANTLHQRLGRAVILHSAHGDLLLTGQASLFAPDPIFLVESSSGIVNQVEAFLNQHQNSKNLHEGKRRLFCTDAPERFEKVARIFSQDPLPAVEVIRFET